MNKIKSIISNVKNHKKGLLATLVVAAATLGTAIVVVNKTKKSDSFEDELEVEVDESSVEEVTE